jgi:hypothetical protein
VLCINLQQGHFTANQTAHSETVKSPSPLRVPLKPTAQNLSVAATANGSGLNNRDILDMNKAGLPPEVLVAKIKSSECNFDTSPASLQALKAAGLGDSVILAMVEAPTGQPKAFAVIEPLPQVVASSSVDSNPTTVPSDGKVRVLVTDSQSWETRGGGSAGGNRNGWAGSSWIAGGARPQTVEIIKTLNQRCPEITVTDNLERADFVITLDHEGGKALLAHRNKIAVFNKDGDDIFSNSTVELGNSVKDACQAIHNDRKK